MTTEHQLEAPARYRVREPVTLDAIRWTGGNAEAVREFGAVPDFIPVGCWVLRGVTGHVFTVDAERFAAIYEPAGEEEAPSVSSPPVAAALGSVEELRRIADQDIGGNAPWLADKLHAFADQLAAEMRGECQMAPSVAAALDRESVRQLIRNTIDEAWLAAEPKAEMVTDAIWPLLEHAQAAAAGSHEGVRLWMLDCGELVAKYRARAEDAEGKLAELHAQAAEAQDLAEGATERAGAAEAKLRQIAAYVTGNRRVRVQFILGIIGSETQERSEEKGPDHG